MLPRTSQSSGKQNYSMYCSTASWPHSLNSQHRASSAQKRSSLITISEKPPSHPIKRRIINTSKRAADCRRRDSYDYHPYRFPEKSNERQIRPPASSKTLPKKNKDSSDTIYALKPIESEIMRYSSLGLRFHDATDLTSIKRPDEIQLNIPSFLTSPDGKFFNHIAGSLFGLAIGDALGAHVEFRPHQYLQEHPVTDFQAGGTWGLEKGQFTDDTSMALCLANSLIACHGFNLYDQLVRYKWWYRLGYMSSTGKCFDIGNATKLSIEEFERRQQQFAETHGIALDKMDQLDDQERLKEFETNCSEDGVAGNGALMRLAPVPLFFFRDPPTAVEYSGQSGLITHGDRKAYDACRYYGALIVAALHDYSKDQLLDHEFYEKHVSWFGGKDLHPDIMQIAEGSYEKSGGYADGIRGGGYIVKALEAALWSFWSTKDFRSGAIAAVNLGDDTDTTAAIFGQVAGAFYGYSKLPKQWEEKVYARKFLLNISRCIEYEGGQCDSIGPKSTLQSKSDDDSPIKKQALVAKSDFLSSDVARKESSLMLKSDQWRTNEFALDSDENRKQFREDISRWLKPILCQSRIKLIDREDHYQLFLDRINSYVNEKQVENVEHHRLKLLAGQVKHHQSSSVSVTRGWISCDDKKKSIILENGFPELDRKRIESTGKGLCLKSSAQYAAEEIFDEGYLIMCYIVIHDPKVTTLSKTVNSEQYRFYNGEKPSIRAKSSKKTASAPCTRSSSDVKNGLYDQIIVFDPKDILVRAVVHIHMNAKARLGL